MVGKGDLNLLSETLGMTKLPTVVSSCRSYVLDESKSDLTIFQSAIRI